MVMPVKRLPVAVERATLSNAMFVAVGVPAVPVVNDIVNGMKRLAGGIGQAGRDFERVRCVGSEQAGRRQDDRVAAAGRVEVAGDGRLAGVAGFVELDVAAGERRFVHALPDVGQIDVRRHERVAADAGLARARIGIGDRRPRRIRRSHSARIGRLPDDLWRGDRDRQQPAGLERFKTGSLRTQSARRPASVPAA